MIVEYGVRELKICVEFGSDDYVFCNNFISKHLKNRLDLKHSSLIFGDFENLIKKEYFLLQVHSRLGKDADRRIFSYLRSPIRISYYKEKRLGLRDLKILEKDYSLVLETNDTYLQKWLKNHFKEFLSSENLEIEINTKSLQELSAIFNSGFFLGTAIDPANKYIINNLQKPFRLEFDTQLLEHLYTLNCNLRSTKKEIKTSYINLTKEFHPDKVFGDENLTSIFTKKFQQINAAYFFVKKHLNVA